MQESRTTVVTLMVPLAVLHHNGIKPSNKVSRSTVSTLGPLPTVATAKPFQIPQTKLDGIEPPPPRKEISSPDLHGAENGAAASATVSRQRRGVRAAEGMG